MVSTALDYAKFLQMLINGGKLSGVRLLKEETVQNMTRNHLEGSAFPIGINDTRDGFGFGFGL